MGRDIQTAVNYYDDPGDGTPPTPVYVGSMRITNSRPMLSVPVMVADITGSESTFTLNTHGFQYHTKPTPFSAFHDEERIRNEYYKECEHLIRNLTNASNVLAFDHKVRRGPSHWHNISQDNAASRGPLHRAHVDQSYDGAVMRLKEQFPSDSDFTALSQKRWQIINIWRPLTPILKDPLALCDSRTVPDTDLLPASIIYVNKSNKRNESWTVKPPNPSSSSSSSHKWYFKYHQQPSEVILIKCFDSDLTCPARRTPHCAVEDPDHKDGESRESVEVRCLVFY
ncbi:hypothetical protein B0T21DRAFT_277959 [Apiosordaria backusii]|uniref:Uncharacterized protein n=1 Tax=Apiosordaria backusii TaxID=314023 RepID=A0AA40EZE1_9PEZI|nr:hypothetical protein B0T21DRAFT_277959 [Apiosordaria backusii]